MTPEITVILTALAIYAAGAVSPGPSFTLILRLAASGARPAAFGATVGFSIGAATYATLAMTGFALVITRMGWLMSAVQIAGGCYLIYMGLSPGSRRRPILPQARFVQTPAASVAGCAWAFWSSWRTRKASPSSSASSRLPFRPIRRFGRRRRSWQAAFLSILLGMGSPPPCFRPGRFRTSTDGSRYG